jgi:hypothetical protein
LSKSNPMPCTEVCKSNWCVCQQLLIFEDRCYRDSTWEQSCTGVNGLLHVQCSMAALSKKPSKPELKREEIEMHEYTCTARSRRHRSVPNRIPNSEIQGVFSQPSTDPGTIIIIFQWIGCRLTKNAWDLGIQLSCLRERAVIGPAVINNSESTEDQVQSVEGRQTAKTSKVGLSHHWRQGSSPHSRQT